MTFSDYKDGLIYVRPNADKTDGELADSRLLWTLGNFSRFVRPGAVRIGSSSFAASLEQVAFCNPDGSVAAVLLNRGPARQINLRMEGQTARVPLPAQSICTLTLREG